MGKINKDQKGFGAIEVLLLLIFLALVVLIGVYVAHNRSTSQQVLQTNSAAKTNSSKSSSPSHTPQEATQFVQSTYNDYLSAINNAGPNNTQPLGLVGLAAVKANLSAPFYSQASQSQNGSDFSCAAQFMPSGYTASLSSSNSSQAKVGVTIANSPDSSTTTSGMEVTVDLSTLKITAVKCPN